ncbi:hypothetical protein EHS13_04280 [Paenibacillus psychroresistens]|uniref:Heparinase n=1 Tax=Paenibacillus psychroresistens TaxID=1778678 RepID=A0A6B8RFH9_9BACL|nr:hypothetical protein [Paenibacillus psychroresistens]QGQ94178.1 hypothetical protein EHS13_04280 [Paenibacillus psychroresistens]
MKVSQKAEEASRVDGKWKEYYLHTLEAMHKDYNPDNHLLRRPFTSPGYHTAIKAADFVHPTREALDYALALLDSGDVSFKIRAFDIIRTMVSLQDQDPASATFGIWSWFWEEPLAQMAPPDWNWADFCGKKLLIMLIKFGHEMPEDLRRQTEQAIRNSCEAIIKRNVGPQYTNIAIMGAFVTLVAGEWLKDANFLTYGLNRLEKFFNYTKQYGAFLEYNSPTYSIVSIVELSGIDCYTSIPKALKMTEELLDMTWAMVAEHFHPVLKQWSGPHSRSYDTFLTAAKLSFLQMACDNAVPFIAMADFEYELEWYGKGIRCPERYWKLFQEPGVRELIQPQPPSGDNHHRIAYTFMNPDLSIGSFSSGIMWNQSRNLIGYVKSGKTGSVYVQLRVLKDGYDYCSAAYHGQQQETNVLFGIQFLTDGGDTHPNLDLANGRITTSDLRIRVEIRSSDDSFVRAQSTENSAQVDLDGLMLSISNLYGEMDDKGPFRWEITNEAGLIGLDYVLYCGERQEIDFHRMAQASFLFSLVLSATGELPEAAVHTMQQRISADLVLPDGLLSLTIGKKPDTRAVIFQSNPLE